MPCSQQVETTTGRQQRGKEWDGLLPDGWPGLPVGLSSRDPPLGAFDELHQIGYLGAVPDLLFHPSHGLSDAHTGLEEETVGASQALKRLLRKVVSLESNDIEAIKLGPVPLGLHEWGDILIDGRATSNERIPANTTELMHAAEASDNCIILDGHVSC